MTRQPEVDCRMKREPPRRIAGANSPSIQHTPWQAGAAFWKMALASSPRVYRRHRRADRMRSGQINLHLGKWPDAARPCRQLTTGWTLRSDYAPLGESQCGQFAAEPPTIVAVNAPRPAICAFNRFERPPLCRGIGRHDEDRKSTRLNSS